MKLKLGFASPSLKNYYRSKTMKFTGCFIFKLITFRTDYNCKMSSLTYEQTKQNWVKV